MRLFFYKSVFIFISIFILYKVTIGQLIKDYENRIDQTISKENINKFEKQFGSVAEGEPMMMPPMNFNTPTGQA